MDQAAVMARLKRFEGSVPFMYKCTGGEVTIGVGHAIHGPAEAGAMSWQIGGADATADQSQADYQKVAAAPKGLPAPRYSGLTQCRMSDENVERLLAADVGVFEAQLAAALPEWNSYPVMVQEAVFDMAFNLGVGGLKKFSKLLAAVEARDWNTAAAECHRQGIGDDRNQETARLFRQASAAAAG
jgi:GH24 family phage-related lysozyme (muramidase)